MKCGNCPIYVKETYITSPDGEKIYLYECPFGEHALHLWDHRCTKFLQRKEEMTKLEKLQNGGIII